MAYHTNLSGIVHINHNYMNLIHCNKYQLLIHVNKISKLREDMFYLEAKCTFICGIPRCSVVHVAARRKINQWMIPCCCSTYQFVLKIDETKFLKRYTSLTVHVCSCMYERISFWIYHLQFSFLTFLVQVHVLNVCIFIKHKIDKCYQIFKITFDVSIPF